MEEGWYPDNPYLLTGNAAVASPRPINQGDVFGMDGVAKGYDAPGKGGQQKVAFSRPGLFMVVSHPCTMRAGGELKPLVTISPISRLASLNPKWGPPWVEGNYGLYPLPALGEEDMAANLALSAMYKSHRLASEMQRYAILSQDGFIALQRRLCEALSRWAPDRDVIAPRAEAYWLEFDLWERWTVATGSEKGFQSWYDEHSTRRPDWIRREAAEMLGRAILEAEMDEHFGS